MATLKPPSPSNGGLTLSADSQSTRKTASQVSSWYPAEATQPDLRGRKAVRFRAVRFAPDQEKRQSRRRGLRCPMSLLDSRPGTDSRPRSIPAQCYNISDTGLYGVVPIGYGVTMGQRYTFQLNIPERGPECTPCQVVSQQGIIVRTELLISPDGKNDRVGIGVRLVGPRSGVVPMPEHAL